VPDVGPPPRRRSRGRCHAEVDSRAAAEGGFGFRGREPASFARGAPPAPAVPRASRAARCAAPDFVRVRERFAWGGVDGVVATRPSRGTDFGVGTGTATGAATGCDAGGAEFGATPGRRWPRLARSARDVGTRAVASAGLWSLSVGRAMAEELGGKARV